MADTSFRPVGELVPAHPVRRFHLASEPWIPVVDHDGQVSECPLDELLARAHELRDLAAVDPLAQLSLIRFLLAATYLIRAYDPDADWQAVADARAPLPRGGVAATLERLEDHLWLFHPETPFLQRPQLRDHMKAPTKKTASLVDATKPFEELLPQLPSGNNPLWYGRGDAPLAPEPAEAVRALLQYHYMAMPGNRTPVQIPGRRNRGKWCEGGPVNLVVRGQERGRSFLWFVASNLAATLATNLLHDWVAAVTPDNVLFWEDPTSPATHLEDPLYVYTCSDNATFLTESAGAIRALVSANPVSSSAAKPLVDRAEAQDPHTLTVDPTGKSRPRDFVYFDPDQHQHESLRNFYDVSSRRSRLQQPCLIARHALHVAHPEGLAVRLANIQIQRTQAELRVAAAVEAQVDPALLLLEDEQAEAFADLLERFGGTTRSVLSRTRWRVRQALNLDAREPLAAAIGRQVAAALWAGIEPIVTQRLEAIRAGRPDADQLDGAQRVDVVDTALAAYDGACGPYERSPRFRAPVINQRIQLRNDLRRMLDG